MSEPDSPSAATPILARLWAVRIGAALLVALAAIVALVLSDNSQRAHLETMSETTAVGDLHYYRIPEGAPLPLVAASLGGKPLLLADARPIELRETHTRRIGSDAAAGVTLYALSAAATASERQRVGGGGTATLLKVGVNQFVAVRPGAAQ